MGLREWWGKYLEVVVESCKISTPVKICTKSVACGDDGTVRGFTIECVILSVCGNNCFDNSF